MYSADKKMQSTANVLAILIGNAQLLKKTDKILVTAPEWKQRLFVSPSDIRLMRTSRAASALSRC
jgi:hypothetical protein